MKKAIDCEERIKNIFQSKKVISMTPQMKIMYENFVANSIDQEIENFKKQI